MLTKKISPKNAQKKINFILHYPIKKFDITNHSLRIESMPYNQNPKFYNYKPWSNWSSAHTYSYTFEIFSPKGEKIKCKQFLYDFGPLSILDHAALYDHYSWNIKANPIDNQNIYWTGYDYHNKKCLSFLSHGTNIELRCLDNKCTYNELIEIAKSLQPINKHDPIFSKKFHELTYWNRYKNPYKNACLNNNKYRPPSSMWPIRFPYFNGQHIWSSPTQEDESYLQKKFNFLIKGYYCDSICNIFIEQNLAEKQFLLYPNNNKNCIIYLRKILQVYSPIKNPGFSRLPETEKFSNKSNFYITIIERNKTKFKSNIYIASINENFGPHDLIWWDEQDTLLLQITSHPHYSIDYISKVFIKPLFA